jgi:thioredoxin 1
VVELNESNFEQEVINSDKPVLVDFWASWCMPCQKLAPIIEEVSKEYNDKVKFAKVNVEKVQSVPQRYGIRSIPTLLLFKSGQVVIQLIGLQPKGNIEKIIEDSLK